MLPCSITAGVNVSNCAEQCLSTFGRTEPSAGIEPGKGWKNYYVIIFEMIYWRHELLLAP